VNSKDKGEEGGEGRGQFSEGGREGGREGWEKEPRRGEGRKEELELKLRFRGRLPWSLSVLPPSLSTRRQREGREEKSETSRPPSTNKKKYEKKGRESEREKRPRTHLPPPSDRFLIESLLLRVPDVGVHDLCKRKMISLPSLEDSFVVGSFLRNDSSNGVLDFEHGGAEDGGGEESNRESMEIKERVSFRVWGSGQRGGGGERREVFCWVLVV